MKIHHFIVPDEKFNDTLIVVSDFNVIHQIRKVLKLRVGEEVVIGNGSGIQGTHRSRTGHFVIISNPIINYHVGLIICQTR